jgi:hypothetical protein
MSAIAVTAITKNVPDHDDRGARIGAPVTARPKGTSVESKTTPAQSPVRFRRVVPLPPV